MSLTKREIAQQVASLIGSTKSDAAAAVQATLDIMAKELAAGGHIELRGFGVFEVKTRKASIGRNPRKPQDTVKIPARKVVKFRAGKELKEAVEKLDCDATRSQNDSSWTRFELSRRADSRLGASLFSLYIVETGAAYVVIAEE